MKRLFLLLLAGGLLAGSDGSLLLAQTTPKPPSVGVRRITSLEGSLISGDFNRDGKIDLASRSSTPRNGSRPLLVALGRGDGSFNAPLAITEESGSALAAGDFNNDGKLDLVVILDQAVSPVFLLLGRGDGTFGTPLQIGGATEPSITFAFAEDLDRDGNLDLAVGMIGDTDQGLVLLYAGRGDGTFSDGTARLDTGVDSAPVGGVAADLNGDGLPDVAVASRGAQSVSIFLNQGALNFTSAERPLGHPASDVTAADVDGDHKLDLIVSQSFDRDGELEGLVSVLPGNGDGTFGAGRAFVTGVDPWEVTTGDFNRDGVLDIATSNHSAMTTAACAPFFSLWDSLTILNGTGGGNFVRAADFSIGNQQDLDGFRHRDSGRTLSLADLNGDGRADFVLHDGAVFISTSPDPNWAPSVTAGPDRTITGTRRVQLRATATDSDQDMLTWSWSSNAGITIASVPNPCVTVPGDGTYTFTVTVDDRNGHRASDSATYTFGSGGTTPPTDPPTPIGEGWGHSDVGAVGAAGSATFDGFIRDGHGLTVSGSGADIWGTADEFHFAWKTMQGDFQIETRVASIDGVHPWTKAGLMIRQSARAASSAHASIFVTPGNGVVFQRRLSSGAASVSLQGPSLTAPLFLRLVRQRGTVSAWYRKRDVDRWTLLGEQSGMTSPTLDVGLAVTSHADGAIAKAKFEGVYLAPLPAWGINSIGGAGGSVGDTWGTVFTVQGGGTDIWGTSDSFVYMWVRMSGHTTVTARVLGVENTYPWAKAGVMIRESLAPDSKHAIALVTPGKGLALQYRSTTGGTSVMSGQAPGAAPAWVRLSRFEGASPSAIGGVQAQYSTDGVIWRQLGSVNFNMTHDVYVGIAVTSHNPSVPMTATLDWVRVE